MSQIQQLLMHLFECMFEQTLVKQGLEGNVDRTLVPLL